MGGHGGLNILPQKRWNVYNYDNREKVRKDEEAAAREEHVRQQEQRHKESQERIRKLKQAIHPSDENPNPSEEDPVTSNEDVQQMKLFEGLVSFQRLKPGTITDTKEFTGPSQIDKSIFRGDKELERLYKRATKEATKVGKDGVDADDEHYRLGYGSLGKDKKTPWYMSKSLLTEEPREESEPRGKKNGHDGSSSSVRKQKKTIEELRQERLAREDKEHKRTQQLLVAHSIGRHEAGREAGRYYNSSFGNAK